MYEQEMPVLRKRDDACAVAGELARRSGMGLTSQRRAILRALVSGPRHVTAEELHDRARGEAARATVYRLLRSLVRAGLARKVATEEGASRYELATSAATVAHAICRRCGKVMDIEGSHLGSLMEGLARIEDFDVSECELRLHGLCGECARR